MAKITSSIRKRLRNKSLMPYPNTQKSRDAQIPTLAEARQLRAMRLKILKINNTKLTLKNAERIGRNTRLAYAKLEKLEHKIYARIKKSNKRNPI